MSRFSVRSSVSKCLLVFVLILLAVSSFPTRVGAAEKLSNEDIIKMHHAGLSPEVIIQTIRSSSTQFDISTDGLIALKKEGIPDTVIQAMIAPESGDASNAKASSAPLGEAANSGTIVMIDGSQRTAMRYVHYSVRTSGMLGAMVPIRGTKGRMAVEGNHAQLRTVNTSPVFELFIPAAETPSDYVKAIIFNVKSDRREIENMSIGLTGTKSGFPNPAEPEPNRIKMKYDARHEHRTINRPLFETNCWNHLLL